MTTRHQKGFAEMVASARQSSGLSQRALAECVGVCHTAIQQIERGKYVPSDVIITNLAACLGHKTALRFFCAAQRLTPQASAVVRRFPGPSSALLEVLGDLQREARELLIHMARGLEQARARQS